MAFLLLHNYTDFILYFSHSFFIKYILVTLGTLGTTYFYHKTKKNSYVIYIPILKNKDS